MKKQIIQKAKDEIFFKNFGFTEQFLKVHEIALDCGSPKIAGLRINNTDKLATVYFKVKGEEFYFVVYVDFSEEIRVKWVEEEAHHECVFIVLSHSLSLEEMLFWLDNVKPSETWVKNPKAPMTSKFCQSGFSIEVNKNPGSFEDKILQLLEYLETDIKAFHYLSNYAKFYIQVNSTFHTDPKPGGYTLNYSLIHRLNELKINIDIAIYISGNSIYLD